MNASNSFISASLSSSNACPFVSMFASRLTKAFSNCCSSSIRDQGRGGAYFILSLFLLPSARRLRLWVHQRHRSHQTWRQRFPFWEGPCLWQPRLTDALRFRRLTPEIQSLGIQIPARGKGRTRVTLWLLDLFYSSSLSFTNILSIKLI